MAYEHITDGLAECPRAAFGRFLPLAKGSIRPVPDLEIVPQICKNGLCSGGINFSWTGVRLCDMSAQQIQFTVAIKSPVSSTASAFKP